MTDTIGVAGETRRGAAPAWRRRAVRALVLAALAALLVPVFLFARLPHGGFCYGVGYDLLDAVAYAEPPEFGGYEDGSCGLARDVGPRNDAVRALLGVVILGALLAPIAAAAAMILGRVGARAAVIAVAGALAAAAGLSAAGPAAIGAPLATVATVATDALVVAPLLGLVAWGIAAAAVRLASPRP